MGRQRRILKIEDFAKAGGLSPMDSLLAHWHQAILKKVALGHSKPWAVARVKESFYNRRILHKDAPDI